MRKTKSKKEWIKVDGFVLEPGDKVWWTPPDDSWRSYCYDPNKTGEFGCRVPQEVEIDRFDEPDRTATYSVKILGMCQVCKNHDSDTRWVSNIHLRVMGADAPEGSAVKVASDLATAVEQETITLKDLKERVRDLRTLLIQESMDKGAPAAALCSKCMDDVNFTAGEWKHAKTKDCTPTALILA